VRSGSYHYYTTFLIVVLRAGMFSFSITMQTKDKTLISQAEWVGAIGEPTRLSILFLLTTGQQTVTRIATALRVEIVNISHHLKLLKQAGLVSSEKDGRMMIYSLVGAKVTAGMLELSHPSGVKVTLPLA